MHRLTNSSLEPPNPPVSRYRHGLLWANVAATSGIYAWILRLSYQFEYESPGIDRPLSLVVGLFCTAFALHLLALKLALGSRDLRSITLVIWVGAIAFRGFMLPSLPIQEIDIYRYLWDGTVTTQGVSPFRHSPNQVLNADAQADLPADLRRLVGARDGSTSRAEVLRRVHFGELPTIYPPVSQAVFALASIVTPSQASVQTHVRVMKLILIGFDLGTLALVMLLLRQAGQHPAWGMAYGWCPLVIKEFANSGHLDTIAVFLTTAALACLVRAMGKANGRKAPSAIGMTLLASVLLTLGVGAKLYPIVLAPLLIAFAWRSAGVRVGLLCASIIVGLSALLLWPMFPETARDSRDQEAKPAVTVAAQDPSQGLATFLQRWEINDFLFLILVENVKPTEAIDSADRPWFAVVPQPWRIGIVRPIAKRWNVTTDQAAFLLTRCVTAALFAVFAAVFIRKAIQHDSMAGWLEAAFLTQAWFWLLAPTQNPWYWIWAMPLVPFARNRVWLALSGFVLMYYFRFWLAYHWLDTPVAGTSYRGTLFFDFVLVWLEFGPFLVGLALCQIAANVPQLTDQSAAAGHTSE